MEFAKQLMAKTAGRESYRLHRNRSLVVTNIGTPMRTAIVSGRALSALAAYRLGSRTLDDPKAS
jgi:hypothetical protein